MVTVFSSSFRPLSARCPSSSFFRASCLAVFSECSLISASVRRSNTIASFELYLAESVQVNGLRVRRQGELPAAAHTKEVGGSGFPELRVRSATGRDPGATMSTGTRVHGESVAAASSHLPNLP